ncbi:MAG: CHAT domain-containing protein [Planctomycetaceae bacterium]|jgi:CHAT domain-containing protein|nr:CHAT domain-containing protein [Planctomycetaceae bacterium]
MEKIMMRLICILIFLFLSMYGIDVFAEQEVRLHNNNNKTTVQLLSNPSYQLVLNSKVDRVVITQLDVEKLFKENKYHDVIKAIDSLKKTTAYLQQLKLYAQHQIDGINAVTDDPKQLAERIYRILEIEKWNTAFKELSQLEELNKANPDEEITALIYLFKGIVLAQSGIVTFSECSPLFDEANRILNNCAKRSPKDEQRVALSRFRVATHYGDYLMQISRYRNSNHALFVADDSVFTDALLAWTIAYDMYNKANRIAAKSLKDQHEFLAASRLNLARLYLLRSSIVRTMTENATDKGVITDVFSIDDISFEMLTSLIGQVHDQDIKNANKLLGQKYQLLANAAIHQSDYEEALQHAEKAKQYYLESGRLSNFASMERLLGNIAGKLLRTETELEHLLNYDVLLELLREAIPADDIGLQRAGYMARRIASKERLIELLIEKHRETEALQILEAAKGRSLHDILIESHQELRTDWSVHTVNSIIKKLPDNTAVLEYFIGRNGGWGFFVINNKIKAFRLQEQLYDNPFYGKELPAKEIISVVQKCLANDLSNTASASRGFESMAQRMAKRLKEGSGYSRRWQDSLFRIRNWLLPDYVLHEIRQNKIETVLIVPHHVLHYLPFAALVTERDKTNDQKKMPQPKFLIDENFSVFYAPSLSGWSLLQQRNSKTFHNISAIGISEFTSASKLDGVKKDLENVKKIFGDAVSILAENQVTKNSIVKVLGEPGFLLIGTHGMNDAEKPLKSYLLLRKMNDEDDDIITAGELFYTSVKKDLIVLSTCYSGLSEKSPLSSDDLFGIQRALLQSGAGAVITSVWDVYDRTGPLVINGMMQHLANGKPATIALAQAQREFLQQERKEKEQVWTHPYFWAMYVLSGNGAIRYVQQNPRKEQNN